MLDTWKDIARAGSALLSVVLMLQAAMVWVYLETPTSYQWFFYPSLVLAFPAYVLLLQAYTRHPRGGNRYVVYGLFVASVVGWFVNGFSATTVPPPPIVSAMRIVLLVHLSGLIAGAAGSLRSIKKRENSVTGQPVEQDAQAG